jgi:hypothetical protein
MSELAQPIEVLTSATTTSMKENIPPRKTVVYQTLIDSALIKIEGERNKTKLFSKFLFRRIAPEEVELVSVEKYYEPYLMISGKYLIDYYRKNSYMVWVDKEVKEVVLLGQSFTPRRSQASSSSNATLMIEGEERITKDVRSLVILDKNGQDSKTTELPLVPSEENPQKIFKSFKMAKIAPELDSKVINTRIVQRPEDACRIVNEELEVDERSVIYAPRFRLTYKCGKLGKEAFMEFDGVTSKPIKKNKQSVFAKLKILFSEPKHLIDIMESM